MILFAKLLCVSMTLLRRNDVQKFDADSILFIEIQFNKSDMLMFKRRLQCGVG